MEQFKFSIIMPVYNAEKFLSEAIDSILQQDIGFKENVQLILIDDGSVDSSGVICDSYAVKYKKNIIVIHKDNGGVASARNAGLPYAKGRYLTFIDSDDKFTTNTLLEVYKFFINHEEETDVVAIPLYFFDSQTGAHYLNYKFSRGNRVIDLLTEYNAAVRTIGGSFFKYQCKSDIYFDNRLIMGEDVKVNLLALHRKMKLGVVSSCKYMYRKRNYGKASIVQHHEIEKDYYFGYFTYLSDWVMNFYKERLGFVPGFVQYTIMIEFAWQIRSNYNIAEVLTVEEIERYKNKLFDTFKYIDDRYILGQIIIWKEHKNFMLSKKYKKKAQVTIYDNDALIHFDDSIICRVSDCYTMLEFIVYKNKVLYLEGFTKILGADDNEKIEVYILCNDKKILCELLERRDITESCLGEDIFKGIAFKVQVSVEDLPCQGEIKFGITFRGIDILKKDFRLGKFCPIVQGIKNSYYYEDNLMIIAKGQALLWRKCTKRDAKNKEILLLKELWNTGKKAARKAAVLRCFYHLIKPLYKKEIWILSNITNEADDNSKALFKYINENKLPVNVYFVLKKGSEDYREVKKFGKVLQYMSWKHKFMQLLADKIISASADSQEFNPFQKNEKYYHDILVNERRIFLHDSIINRNNCKRICDAIQAVNNTKIYKL